MKILIAVPTFESIYPDTFKSIWELDPGEHDLYFDFVRGYDCATARNRIAQRALDKGVDYVLMVDNDVILPSDVLLNLLDDSRDVVLGYYAHRGNDNLYHGRMSVCKYWQMDGVPWYNYPLESEYTAAEMEDLKAKGEYKIRIHGGGMGCALIKTDIFRRIEYPWYDWVNYGGKERGMLSEDLYFCERCKEKHIPIYTDSRAGCGHIFRHVQWPERI